MSTSFTSLRSLAQQVDVLDSAPTGDDLYEGRIYFSVTDSKLYAYVNGAWRYLTFA
jgi:hypothetical protein